MKTAAVKFFITILIKKKKRIRRELFVEITPLFAYVILNCILQSKLKAKRARFWFQNVSYFVRFNMFLIVTSEGKRTAVLL